MIFMIGLFWKMLAELDGKGFTISKIVIFGTMITAFLWTAWIQIKPFIQKVVVLRVGPEGVSSYYIHNRVVSWDELLDVKITSLLYDGRFPPSYILKMVLILKKDSPLWMATRHKWIFWHRNNIRILFTALPAKEQVWAALALLSAYAHYGNARTARFMLGTRRGEAEQAFKNLKQGARWKDIELPEILKRADSFFFHADKN
jgi:hypothetical protein